MWTACEEITRYVISTPSSLQERGSSWPVTDRPRPTLLVHYPGTLSGSPLLAKADGWDSIPGGRNACTESHHPRGDCAPPAWHLGRRSLSRSVAKGCAPRTMHARIGGGGGVRLIARRWGKGDRSLWAICEPRMLGVVLVRHSGDSGRDESHHWLLRWVCCWLSVDTKVCRVSH